MEAPRKSNARSAIPDILERISRGESLCSACRAHGTVQPHHVIRILRADDALWADYARAREAGYELLADQLLDLADAPVEGSDAVQQLRLRVDTRKWMLAKMLPKVFGDKQTLEHTGEGGGPVQMQVITGLTRGPGGDRD